MADSTMGCKLPKFALILVAGIIHPAHQIERVS